MSDVGLITISDSETWAAADGSITEGLVDTPGLDSVQSVGEEGAFARLILTSRLAGRRFDRPKTQVHATAITDSISHGRAAVGGDGEPGVSASEASLQLSMP